MEQLKQDVYEFESTNLTENIYSFLESKNFHHEYDDHEYIFSEIEDIEERIYALKEFYNPNVINAKHKDKVTTHLSKSLKKLDKLVIKFGYVDKVSAQELMQKIESDIRNIKNKIKIFENFIQNNHKEIIC